MINLKEITTEPGCYLFKDNNGKILYIGKATNLRKRVSSYFQKKDLDPKTASLVKNIDSVETIITDNEVEALILENTLVKKHLPKYNIDLKDSKTFAYLLITDEEYPRLLIARQKTDGGDYFGPFVSAEQRDHIKKALITIFKIRTCKKIPKKACLRYHIGLCEGPCIKGVTSEEYSKRIQRIEKILRGNMIEMIKELEIDMNKDSVNENYEQALEKRNQINALKTLNETQNVQRRKEWDEDIINYVKAGNTVYLTVFHIHKGTLDEKEEYQFENEEELIEQFMVRYYDEERIPNEIVLPHNVDNSIKQYLEQKKKEKVIITVPIMGEKKELLTLAYKNIESAHLRNKIKLEALQTELKLNEVPGIIECFDISHLSGTSMVGSMVLYRNGNPDKRCYRRFKIRTLEGIDDTAAIGEIVKRRYQRQLNEAREMPNLIVIDGGKGQLNAAMKELTELGLKIPVISIAKRLEEVYVPGLQYPLQLNEKNEARKLVQAIRDEAHRFAIKYNRLLRSKKIHERKN